MNISKTVKESQVIMHELVLPNDTNVLGKSNASNGYLCCYVSL